jgi:hypothetical protein
VVEEVDHVAAEGVVVAVDGGPGSSWSAAAGHANSGDDGGGDLVAVALGAYLAAGTALTIWSWH